jgi:hypothetical protein
MELVRETWLSIKPQGELDFGQIPINPRRRAKQGENRREIHFSQLQIGVALYVWVAEVS